MSEFKQGDCRLHYEIHGRGQPVLLVHGLGSSTRDWEYQLPVLKQHFQVISLDLRGHGRSDKPRERYSIAGFAEDVGALIRHLELPPVHLVGISMGGMVGFQLAVDQPQLLRSLTVVNSGPEVKAHSLRDSPRTTCVACLIQNNVAYWAHVGDSRLYLIRGGRVATRTRDHSRVQLLIDQGIITEAQAATHPERNKIYSCLGGYQPPDIEFSRKTPLEAGDVLALCTDGLWGVVPEETLIAGLQQENLIQAVPKLLNFADAHGGPNADNLSIVAVRWEDSYVDATSGLSSVISTQTMAPETVTTRLDAFGRNPKYKTELSEDEIERAIEEIRSTIQKFSK